MTAQASLDDVTGGSPATVAALVVGGDVSRRARVVALLEGAGIAARASADTTAPAPDLAAGGLVVLLCDGPARERVRPIRAASRAHPDALVLAVLASDTPNASMRRALLGGTAGIVFDDDLERALVPTCGALLAGQISVPTALSRQIAPEPLSHREKQILGLVVRGCTNREIAQRLFLAESTVKTHLSSAFRKVDARSRSEVVALIQDPDSPFGREVLALADAAAASA